MAIIFLALGSNVGDSRKFLDAAVYLLGSKISNIEIAPYYSSKAVGYTDQPDFINTALTGQTDMNPLELLHFIKSIEDEVGRIKRFRWGPREIDIDIIFYGDQIIDEPGLRIPHPRFAERDFVLRPIMDLNPGLVDPESEMTVKQLYNKLPPGGLAIIDDGGHKN